MTRREAGSAVASAAAATWAVPERGPGAAPALPEGRVAGQPSARFEIARVLSRDDQHALIDLPGRQVWARIAIPPPATMDAGDFVVVAGRDSEWWAVGTLGDPQGATRDALPTFGDDAGIVIHAPRGRLSLTAARLWLGGERVSLLGRTLRATATTCLLRCQSVNQWIAGLVSQTVGRLYQGVDGDYHHRSRSIAARAEGRVTIKGERVHLN